MIDRTRPSERGMVLAVVLVLVALLMVLIAGFASLTAIEMATTRSSMRSFQGFYAAEAGLNARADEFRQLFVDGALPTGAGPSTSGAPLPCVGSNQGTGNFACSTYTFQSRDVHTYVVESPLSTDSIVIPRGEDFQDLFGKEYHYVVYSESVNDDASREASLEMHFKSRTIPLFQFAAFYNKDLEILPSPGWVLAGPVHSNRDLYVGCDNTLDIARQVTAAGDLYRGRKDASTCLSGPVRVPNPATLTNLPTCTSGRRQIAQPSLTSWNKMVNTVLEPVSVPGADILDPQADRPYWARADLRVALDLTSGTPAIQVRNVDSSVNTGETTHLTSCGATSTTNTMYDNREGGLVRMLEVDVRALLTCPHLGQMINKNLNATPELPLVLFFTVVGPDSAGVNRYGVRLRNGSELKSPLSTSSAVLTGLTVVSDQAVYIQGNYNSTYKKPAAVLGDRIDVLSNSWNDANSTFALASRVPSATTIHAALLAGTDSTGGAEGAAGQDHGGYNGGLESFLRLHENWNGTVTLTYLGSFVSLFRPRHAVGAWAYGGSRYTAPIRAWGFDSDFEDPETFPPMSPQFVYLRQELFVRRFEL